MQWTTIGHREASRPKKRPIERVRRGEERSFSLCLWETAAHAGTPICIRPILHSEGGWYMEASQCLCVCGCAHAHTPVYYTFRLLSSFCLVASECIFESLLVHERDLCLFAISTVPVPEPGHRNGKSFQELFWVSIVLRASAYIIRGGCFQILGVKITTRRLSQVVRRRWRALASSVRARSKKSSS